VRGKWWGSGTAVVVWIAVGTVVVHLATGWRYGFDRDELMAVDDARHLAWGYVQYPPMTAFFAWVAMKLFGTSLGMIRLFAALAQAGALVLTGLLAKEMGGGKWAMVVATLAGVPFCLGAGALLQYISFDYVCWVWVAYCVVRVVRPGERRNSKVESRNSEWPFAGAQAERVASGEWRGKDKSSPQSAQRTTEDAERARENPKFEEREQEGARWWVGVGVGMGLGMLAKYTMGFLAVGVVVGVLATGARKYLRIAWLWLGLLLAWLIFLPNLVWEWKRNFVSLDFLQFLHARDVRTGVTDWFLLGQLELTMLMAPLALAGLAFCFGWSHQDKRWRILGWMYVAPLILFLVMRGRDYYLAPAYPMLYAAGAVWVEDREKRNSKIEIRNSEGLAKTQGPHVQNRHVGHPAEERLRDGVGQDAEVGVLRSAQDDMLIGDGGEERRLGRTRIWRRVIWVVLAMDIMVAGAVSLPIAPVGSRWWNAASKVDIVFPEEIGWPEFVEGVAKVRDALPAEERARVGILAGNYGEVGAVNLYGEKYGLPLAMSGVNSSWERGYGDAPEVVIVVGYPREFLEKEFASCVVGGRTRNRYGVANEETVEDPEIFVCRGLKESWGEFWVKVRKFA
jgi:hypothetical protein